jgi:hypothetical protein
MVDDELFIEVDDDDFFDSSAPVGGKVGTALPLTTPTIMPPSTSPIDYRGALSLMDGADKLFDFKGSKLSPVQQMYIIGFAIRGTRKGACQLAGIPYAVVTKWMENEEFTQALQSAVDMARDALEEELLRRAMDGSDRLLLEAVKGAKPEKYNKKQSDVNINGTMVHTWADLARQATAKPLPAGVVEVDE